MCVGSYASRSDNDVEEIVDKFADKVNFVHLRNVEKEGTSKINSPMTTFTESDHLNGDVNMFNVMKRLLIEKKRRKNIHENQGIYFIGDMGRKEGEVGREGDRKDES